MLEIFLASLGMFVGELYGNMVGGGSLVTQTVLQSILHIDIKSAIALDNAAIVGSALGMILIMFRKYAIRWWFLVFIMFQVLGYVLGAWLLVKIDPKLLKIIFVLAVISLVVKNFFIPEKKHHEKGFQVSFGKMIFMSIFAVLLGIYSAAFVVGDWIISLLVLTNLFSVRYQNAVFLLVLSEVFSHPWSAYQYYVHGLLDLNFFIPMALAAFLSGMIAGMILNKINTKKLEIFLKYFSFVLVVYLIFGVFV